MGTKLSEWLMREYPSAAESLLEGLEEMFTINRLDLPSALRRCLASTNIIESPNAGIRQKTRRVTRWRDGQMVLRWTASTLVLLEKRMRRIMGHQQLWMLKAKLQDHQEEQTVARKIKSA
jgi:transposase-like protein